MGGSHLWWRDAVGGGDSPEHELHTHGALARLSYILRNGDKLPMAGGGNFHLRWRDEVGGDDPAEHELHAPHALHLLVIRPPEREAAHQHYVKHDTT